MKSARSKFFLFDWVFLLLLLMIVLLFVRGIFAHDRLSFPRFPGSPMFFAKFGVIAVDLRGGYPKTHDVGSIFEFRHTSDTSFFGEVDWRRLTTTWTPGFFCSNPDPLAPDYPITFDFWLLGFRVATFSNASLSPYWGLWLQIPDWFLMLVLGFRPGRKLWIRFRKRNKPVDPANLSTS